MKLCIVMAGSNVHGRIIADALKRFSPVIVNEVGTDRAAKLSKWLAPDYGPSLPDFVPVDDFAGAKARELIGQADYAINGGAGIFGPGLLALPRLGWLNAHPGLLPEYRGAEPVLWALRNGDPQGATVHHLDQGLDTGPILIRRELHGHGARTVMELRLKAIEFGAALLAEFLSNPSAYPPLEQDPTEGFTYSVYCGGDHAEAERRLARFL